MLYLPPSINFNPIKMAFSTWVDHIPFGYDLVAAMRPKKLVELGTHNGMSFFVFCQAMTEQNIDGSCYAVDTWEGDDHTGNYGEEVFNSVSSHCRENFRGCHYLLRMRFDEAATKFDDDSLDIVHIDGLHTYEAVKEDFETWFGKVRPGGIILFHDVEARIKDFGAWKFWQELESQHQTFKFHHGFGLGVLRKAGGNTQDDPTLLKLMFESDQETQEQLRQFYVHIGIHGELSRKVARQKK
jgi:hypothetical protein